MIKKDVHAPAGSRCYPATAIRPLGGFYKSVTNRRQSHSILANVVNWHFYILVVPALIAIAGGIYFRRKLAKSATPNLRRAQRLVIASVLWALSFGALILINHQPGPLTLRQVLSCTAFVIVLGSFIYQLRKIWPQARAEKLKLRRQKKSPTFFWQAPRL